jgi:hypothetical protein
MSERAIVEDRLRKKEAEIQALEDKIRGARIYMQALSDVLRAMDGAKIGTDDDALKPGTMIAQARDALEQAGKPLHVDELLQAIGRPLESKSSLTGSLAAYVRRNEVFTRPGPNIFGLIDMPTSAKRQEPTVELPPPGFGGGGKRPGAFDDDLEDDVPF